MPEFFRRDFAPGGYSFPDRLQECWRRCGLDQFIAAEIELTTKARDAAPCGPFLVSRADEIESGEVSE